MKFFIFVLFLINATLGFSQEKLIKETELNVAIGIDEIVKLEYRYNTKIQIGNESLLQLVLAPSKQLITFRGVKAGRTSVTVRDSVGDIRDKFVVTITSDGNSNTVRELRELLGEIEGLEIKIKGGKVVVEGEIVVPGKIGRIRSVLSRYPDVLFLVEYSQQTQLYVAREMQDAINKNNMRDVTVRIVNGDFWLEGVVNSQAKQSLAQEIALAYSPDKIPSLGQQVGGAGAKFKVRGQIVNFISVNEKKDPEPPPKLVKIAAQFVELSKDYSKVFAFKWAPFMANESSIAFGKTSQGGVTTSESGTLSGTISRLFPKLHSAKNAGYARVIQSGMAITNEGKAVKISKSSNINFAVGAGDLQSAKSAKLTFEMNTTPRIGNQENVTLDGLTVTVSLPNEVSIGGSPEVTTNTVSTNITVKSKESAVIGGVLQNTSKTDYDKNDPDPQQAGGETNEGAAQSSSLFNLLRSKSYNTKKSQFVVFITPEILESASKGTEEIRKKFRKRER